jgi:hypothetical protein
MVIVLMDSHQAVNPGPVLHSGQYRRFVVRHFGATDAASKYSRGDSRIRIREVSAR